MPDARKPTPVRKRSLVTGVIFGSFVAIFMVSPLSSLFGAASPAVVGTLVLGAIVLGVAAQASARPGDRFENGESRGWWQRVSLPLATPRERALRRTIRLMLAMILLAVVGMLLSVGYFQRPAGALIGIPVIWVSVMVMLAVTTKVSAAHYSALQQLRREGYRVCPGCEYDLRALPPGDGVCPECGRRFDEASLKERWEEVYESLQKKPGP